MKKKKCLNEDKRQGAEAPSLVGTTKGTFH